MNKITLRLAALFASTLLVACVGPTSSVYQSSTAMAPPMEVSTIILPADVVISEYTAGGDKKPRADWSQKVTEDLNEALQGYLYEQGVRFVPYEGKLRDEHTGFIRQANVMLDAIQLSQGNAALGSGGRDYRISNSEREALLDLEANYALLIVLRQNRGTAGRHVVAFLGAVAGAHVETSNAQFRSALIDLRDGQVKWANFDSVALNDIGDVLKASPEKWEKSIAHLMSGFPL